MPRPGSSLDISDVAVREKGSQLRGKPFPVGCTWRSKARARLFDLEDSQGHSSPSIDRKTMRLLEEWQKQSSTIAKRRL
jgi:hypothetical protein